MDNERKQKEAKGTKEPLIVSLEEYAKTWHQIVTIIKQDKVEEFGQKMKNINVNIIHNSIGLIGTSCSCIDQADEEKDIRWLKMIVTLLDAGAPPDTEVHTRLECLNAPRPITDLIFRAFKRNQTAYMIPFYMETIESLLKSGVDITKSVMWSHSRYGIIVKSSLLEFICEIKGPGGLDIPYEYIELFIKYGAEIDSDYVERIKRNLNPLLFYFHKKEIEKLQHELYAPGGPGYKATEEHFYNYVDSI